MTGNLGLLYLLLCPRPLRHERQNLYSAKALLNWMFHWCIDFGTSFLRNDYRTPKRPKVDGHSAILLTDKPLFGCRRIQARTLQSSGWIPADIIHLH